MTTVTFSVSQRIGIGSWSPFRHHPGCLLHSSIMANDTRHRMHLVSDTLPWLELSTGRNEHLYGAILDLQWRYHDCYYLDIRSDGTGAQ